VLDRLDELEARIDADGFVHDGPEEDRVDPLSGESIKARRGSMHHSMNNVLALYKAAAELEAALGFRPTDRARLRVDPDTEDSLSAWEAKRPTPIRALPSEGDDDA
jgi:hypothetical protein